MSHFSNPIKGQQSSALPLSPQQTNYSEGVYRAMYWEGEKKCGIVGPCYLSTAAPDKHALPPDARHGERPPVGSHYTVQADSTHGSVDSNIGFVVRVDYNRSREPVVRVYPYALDAGKGGFFDSRIGTVVGRICSEIARKGISMLVRGQPTYVTPREIVGETTVLDFHGRKPAEWFRPNDNAASLKEVSFSYRR